MTRRSDFHLDAILWYLALLERPGLQKIFEVAAALGVGPKMYWNLEDIERFREGTNE